MSQTRQDFVSDLRTTFQNNPQLYEECLKASMKALQENSPSTVFDYFPTLLPDKAMTDLKQNYQNLMLRIHRRQPQELELNAYEQKLLSRFEMRLAQIACSAILTPEGILKPTLVELMKWGEYADKFQPQQFVIGFLATLNFQIQLELKDLLNEHYQANAMMNNFISKQRHTFTNEAIKQLLHHHDYTNYYVAASTVGVLATGIGTGLVLYGLYRHNFVREIPDALLPDDLSFSFKRN